MTWTKIFLVFTLVTLLLVDEIGAKKFLTKPKKKRKNKPPKARIQIRKASTGTYHEMDLDGRSSTDDLEVKTYKWEMLSGDSVGKIVIRKYFKYKTHKAGLYKWRLTVCDADGECDTEHTSALFRHVTTTTTTTTTVSTPTTPWHLRRITPNNGKKKRILTNAKIAEYMQYVKSRDL